MASPKRSLNLHRISDTDVVVKFWMSLTIAVGIGICRLHSANAADASHDPFLPGYRYSQIWFEDSRKVQVTGIDVGWAAIHSRGFEVDAGTGLRVLSRHGDAYVLPGWTAHMALTVPKTTAPYLEFGFDLGEALARNLLDWAVEDLTVRDHVKPDRWFAFGVRATVHTDWALKLYYKQHFIEGDDYRDLRREVWGVAVVRRFPRVRWLWWQIPL